MNKYLNILIGLVISLLGFYFIKSDWGFVLLTVGSYILFKNIQKVK